MKSIEVTTLEDEYDKKINSWVQEKQKPARKGGSHWSSCSKQLKRLMKRDHSELACEELRKFQEEEEEEEAGPSTMESSLFAA